MGGGLACIPFPLLRSLRNRSLRSAAMNVVVGDRIASSTPRHFALRWLFIGGGALFGRLQAEVASRRYENVTFEPYQARARLAQSLSAIDIHFVMLRPELEGLIVPS